MVAALPQGVPWQITLFGSAPLQLGIDARFLSGDVDVIASAEAERHLAAHGLLKGQREFYIEACPPDTFRASVDWRNRAHVEHRKHVTLIFPHPIDILVSKVSLLEKKDLAAFHLVRERTGMPTEEQLKRALQRIVDIYRPKFDEEAAGDPLNNTRILWRELFGHDIDVRAEIIRPAVEKRNVTYGAQVPDWKSEL